MKFTDIASSGYGDLATTIAAGLASTSEPLVFGICGAQGSGKSTFAKMLVDVLERNHSERVALLSLDDFYLTKAERNELSKNVHPLLATRGVPGTHDIKMMQSAIADLLQGRSASIPIFDKATDDRSLKTRNVGPAKVLLCEGWCWGAAPEPLERLRLPVNQLESSKDPDETWRIWVNDRLREYQSLFQSQQLLFFAAPSFDVVLEWRWRQEQDLSQSAQGDQIMTKAQISEFVAYYQRLTTWMLEEVPTRADVTVALATDHSIGQVIYQGNSGTVQ